MNPQNTQPDPYQTPQAPAPPNQIPPAEKQWAMFSHLSAFSAFLLPLGNIIGPLVMFLIKKDEYRFGTDQAKEALNFNMTCLIYGILAGILCFVVIGLILLPALAIFWFVFTIIATIKANDGIAYRYPLTLRLIP